MYVFTAIENVCEVEILVGNIVNTSNISHKIGVNSDRRLEITVTGRASECHLKSREGHFILFNKIPVSTITIPIVPLCTCITAGITTGTSSDPQNNK